MSVSLTKIPEGTARPNPTSEACSWCYRTATLLVTVPGEWTSTVWTDPVCEAHAVEHFQASIPTPRREPRCEVCGGRGCNH